MKKFILALTFLFVTGCATNGGPFDPNFDWKFGYGKEAPAVIITAPVEVETVPTSKAECINSGNKWSKRKCVVPE